MRYSPGNVRYGGFWIRFFAVFIDALIIGVPFWILDGLISEIDLDESSLEIVGAMSAIASLSVGWLYEALLTSSPRAATLGKQAVGLRVIDIDGSPTSFRRATGRHFAKILSGLFLAIGYLISVLDPQKRTFHDHLCKTLVIRA